MAKVNKKLQPPCPHCGTVFDVKVRWCPSCEGHSGDHAWLQGGDKCDRCLSGENDWYLERKKGRAARIEAAMAALEDKSTWCQCLMCKKKRLGENDG